jgi:hypothetical protein
MSKSGVLDVIQSLIGQPCAYYAEPSAVQSVHVLAAGCFLTLHTFEVAFAMLIAFLDTTENFSLSR